MHISFLYPSDVAGPNVHVITVIEYVDKQEKHMTAKEMECLEEIGVEYFCQCPRERRIKLLHVRKFSFSHIDNLRSSKFAHARKVFQK